MSLPKLVVLHVSPWSERARWALDHHGIAHQTVQHAPFIGEIQLRRLVGRRAGPATVPVLVSGDRVVSESWDIAAWADENGHGTALIPEEHEPAIREWARVADETSKHGRALVVRDFLASPEGLDESLPPFIPQWMRPLSRPVTRFGTAWFGRKYGLDLDAVTEHERALQAALQSLQRSLNGKSYMLGAFTYADIICASFIQGIAPVADEYLRLGPATRAIWTRPALAEEFADLVEWRDELYRKHRNKS